MGADFNILAHPDFAARTAAGYETGQKFRDRRETRNALAGFAENPTKSANALIVAGRPDLADAAFGARKNANVFEAEEAAKPFLATGDYEGAAKAAGKHDAGTMRTLSTFRKEQLDQLQTMNQRGASVIMAASRLPTEQQRRAFIDSHASELQAAGYPAEKVTAYPVGDPLQMRADAASKMSLADLAGKVSVEKFGDSVYTYESDPIGGARQVGKPTLIPPTRADQRADAELEWRKQHGDATLGVDQGRLDLEVKKFDATGGVDSTGDVMGPIYGKIASGAPLTAGEQKLYDDSRMSRMDPYLAGGDDPYGGGPGGGGAPAAPQPLPASPAPAHGGAPAPVAGPRPAPRAPAGAGTQAVPFRPKSRAEAAALRPGAWFVDPSGNLIQKH